MNFSKAIKIIRSVKNLEQRQLAKKIGVDSSYISLIESGKRTPSEKIITKISKELTIPNNLILLLSSEENELKNITKDEAAMIGTQLLEILNPSSQNG
jgi:transcriptional regulator with XRE-family HTH domain